MIPFGSRPKKLPVVLGQEEVHRLIQCVSVPKHRAVLLTLYAAGLRLSEAINLKLTDIKLTDIDSARMQLCIRQAKGNKDRYVPLSPLNSHLAVDLKLWRFDRLEAYRREICGDAGHSVPIGGIPKRLPPQTKLFDVPKQLVKILDRDLAAVGIDKTDERGRTLDVHGMHHTHCTMLSQASVALRTAQAAMRYSRIDLTINVYTDETQLRVRDAVESLPTLDLTAMPTR